MKQIRPLDFKIAMTVMVAVLTAAVLVLATTDRGKHVSIGANKAQVRGLNDRVAALDKRVAALEPRLAAIEQAVAKLSAGKSGGTGKPLPNAQLQSLAAQLRGATQCMFQIQKEIDDLESYLAYRTPLARHRVTGQCASLLKPRFGH
jgi:prefoldin subunit 5